MRVLGELNDAEAVLYLSGEVDIVDAPELRDAISRAFDYGATSIVVDCVGVTFIDSSGLGALVEGHTRAEKEGASFALRSPGGFLRKVLETTGLDRVLRIAPA